MREKGIFCHHTGCMGGTSSASRTLCDSCVVSTSRYAEPNIVLPGSPASRIDDNRPPLGRPVRRWLSQSEPCPFPLPDGAPQHVGVRSCILRCPVLAVPAVFGRLRFVLIGTCDQVASSSSSYVAHVGVHDRIIAPCTVRCAHQYQAPFRTACTARSCSQLSSRRCRSGAPTATPYSDTWSNSVPASSQFLHGGKFRQTVWWPLLRAPGRSR